MNSANESRYTVQVNGDVVFASVAKGKAESRYLKARRTLRAGDVVSFRAPNDMTIRKASIGEDGKTLDWR